MSSVRFCSYACQVKMSLQVVTSEKGKVLMVINGHKFSFQKTLSGGVKRWSCTSRKTLCKAYIKTESEENVIVDSPLDHNHNKLPSPVFKRQQLSNKLKRKAQDDLSERPAKIIHQELKSCDVDTLTVSDINLVRKNLYNARRSLLPPIPKNIGEVHHYLEERQVKTNKNEDFLLKNDRTNNIVMCSCKSNMEFLTTADEFYLDGTFQYCPKFFYQLFTIFAMKNGHYIPVIFFLLPNKQVNTYETALTYMKEEACKVGGDFVPVRITADFEISIHKAIHAIFPNTLLRGCRFHLAQYWYRKIQEVGLISEYNKRESDVAKYLTYVFGLPFLRPQDDGDFFLHLN